MQVLGHFKDFSYTRLENAQKRMHTWDSKKNAPKRMNAHPRLQKMLKRECMYETRKRTKENVQGSWQSDIENMDLGFASNWGIRLLAKLYTYHVLGFFFQFKNGN